jgi:cytochrome c peroxidase
MDSVARRTSRDWLRLAAVAAGAVSVGAALWLLHGASLEQPGLARTAPVPTAKRPAPAADVPAPPRQQTALAALGKQIFFDAGLSEPKGTSCASCHEPEHAFSGTNGSKTGLAQGSRPGHFAARNTPSVLYLKFVKRFHYHWEEDMPLPDAFGGFFWDGRADSISALVRQPLLNPDEMNNRDLAQVARKLVRASYAPELQRALASAGTEAVVGAAGAALEAFLLSPEMAPFSSRFDAYVRGEASLTDMEMRGLALFKDREKGNCLRCHRLNDGSTDPSRSLFSDYGFEVVGVPRNRAAVKQGPARPDLGLCERKGAAKASKEDRFCGAFRTPSLRNVAVRKSFMHNGVFSKLRDVVSFYATRDTEPGHWYPDEKFDDLPSGYQQFVNTAFAPYSSVGGNPRLDDSDIDALVAFLGTLTDAQFQSAANLDAEPSGQRLAERR